MSVFISKSSFLEKRVIPANDNDAFNNGKCAYCWGPYDSEEHPPVRILPCNHVFGKDCLEVCVIKEHEKIVDKEDSPCLVEHLG